MNNSKMTIVAVLIVIAAVLCIGVILHTLFNSVRVTPGFVYDRYNLGEIYQGVMSYADENADQFPRYPSTDDHAQGFNPYLRHSDLLKDGLPLDQEAFDAATDSNITAALWLLIKNDHLDQRVFVSRSSNDLRDDFLDAKGNVVSHTLLHDFPSANHLSYSFINIYQDQVRSHWSHAIGPTYVIAANDNNVWRTRDHVPTSTNYDDLESNTNMTNTDDDHQGMHILFGDGHAEHSNHPLGAFNQQDNIYTWWDQNGQKDDTRSIQALIQMNHHLITSNRTDLNVRKQNAANDVFLLPVESLGPAN